MIMFMKEWYTHFPLILVILVALIDKYPHVINNYFCFLGISISTIGAQIIEIINELI